MGNPVKLLLIEDNDDDAFLVLRQLKREGFDVEHHQVCTAEGVRDALRESHPDLIISDYSMPGFTGLDALKIVREEDANLPFFLVSGTIGEALAVEAMHAGAQDYLMKDNLRRLGEATRRELKEAARKREDRAEQELLRTAISQAAEAVVITAKDGTIEYVNPAFESITGYSREEARGQTPALLKSGTHDDSFYQQLWSTLEAGEVWKGQFVNRRKDGTQYEEEATITPVFDGEGALTHYVAVKRDITEQRRMEEELRQSEKLQVIGQLAGGVAHDFNNQLAGILGYCGLLSNLLDTPKLKRYVNQIETAGNRAADLVKQLLAFSRKGAFTSVPLDLHVLIQEVIDILSRSIDKRIEIRKNLQAEDSVLHGDPTLLQNALLNLCINARDAMPDGGVLTLTTQTSRKPRPSCPPHHDASWLLIQIADTGTGMDAATQSRIFEPFFTTKEESKGTGMGLAAVYGTVKQHEGCIEVSSTPGRGTTFLLCLPLTAAAEPLTESREPSVAPPQAGAHILVADDEALLRELASDTLTEQGYHVTLCEDGEEAIDLYRAAPNDFDLIFLDRVMPKVDGATAFREIRRLNPTARILLASGYSAQESAEELLQEGAAGFIGKPYHESELLNKIAKVLTTPPPAGDSTP
ncbi:MAG: hybrid sensor histidine kinase/response regulator [Planctomycetota bacterium]|jgi:PAS domain S-box-containing protein